MKKRSVHFLEICCVGIGVLSLWQTAALAAEAEPWFDPMRYSWIPGTCIGTLGGIFGSLVGVFAPRGKAKPFVLGFGGILLAASVVMLGLGIFALIAGQPYGIWYGLGLAGFLGTVVLGSVFPVAIRTYQMAEQRRLTAKDL